MERIKAANSGIFALVVVAVLTLSWSVPLESQQTNLDRPPQNQPAEPAPDTPKAKNDSKHYSLSVTVLVDDNPAASPLKGAQVTVFAGDYKGTGPTDRDGKISFQFETDSRTATVRVSSSRYKTDQQQIALNTAERRHQVILKPSD